MKKNRNTLSYILRMLSMTLLPLILPSCRILGLSINASSPNAETETPAALCDEGSDMVSSFGVW